MNKNKHKARLFLFDIFLLFFLVAADQFTKHMAVAKLKGQPDISLIDGVLSLQYVENYGAAFGVLQNQKYFFIISSFVFLCIVLYVLIKMPDASKYNQLNILVVIAAAGAVGNLTDRLSLGYVVDFVYIVLIDFPVFNVADLFVTFSAAIITIQVLFKYEENDFDFLFEKKSES